MKISIFGLGYVGVVSAAILSKEFEVLGVDINSEKVKMIKNGHSPIKEPGIGKLIEKGVEKNNLSATIDTRKAIMKTEISIVCVGTPSNPNGSHDLSSVYHVMEEISNLTKVKENYHCVILRSTVPPGTSEDILKKYFEKQNVGYCYHPEFLREGVAIKDYYNPPFIVASCSDKRSKQLLKIIYESLSKDINFLEFREAEVIKLICNVFHALKVVFSNEIGRFCKKLNIDDKRIMNVFCKDKKLNISEAYLKPGFAFGGSCLPKDLRSFIHLSNTLDVDIPLISSINKSNKTHLDYYIDKIESYKKKKLGFIGLSFKKGTDDVRESPYLLLIEHFSGNGYDIKIYDEDIQLDEFIGSNKRYLKKKNLPIRSLMVNKKKELSDREIIISNEYIDSEFKNKIVINLF